MVYRKIVFVVFCCFGFISQAQIDLLKKAESFDIIDSSIIYAERFIKESYAQKDTVAIIKGGVFLSKQYFQKAKYKEIEIVINQTLPLAVLKKDLTQQASLKLLLAAAYNFGGDNKKALKLYLQVYELYEKLNNPSGIISCANNMAEFYRKVREYDEALKYIRKGFAVYQKQNMNDTLVLVALNNRLAAIMMETSSIDSAIFYSNRAIVLCQKSNNKGGEARSLNEKGQAFKSSGRIDSAIFCFQKAENLWRSIGADSDVMHVTNNRAILYFDNHYPKQLIIQTCLNLINTVKQKKIEFSLENAYSILTEIHLKDGDTSLAFVYQKKYYEIRMDVLKKIYDVGLSDIKEKYENDKMKEDIYQVSSKLEESEITLAQKKRENRIIYSFITALSLLSFFVIYLLLRIKVTNKILKQKNSEKDVLIQEIHHRVKNNLQFVSSLINMQINSSEHASESYSLNDASRRIKAMALVHEMLYNQNEMQGINIQQYLVELVDSINELVNSESIPIKFNVTADSLIFDTQRAIAIGIITSELVSNSIKYAFADTTNPTITIQLTKQSNEIIYSVQDNGGGFKETDEHRKKLGMRLINIFSRQLKGDSKFENLNGYKYIISFKY